MGNDNSQLLVKQKVGHQTKKEQRKEFKGRTNETFCFCHTTYYRVEVIPTLYRGSRKRTYVQLNKFTEEKSIEGH